MTRTTLIHATRLSIPPTDRAFEALWPEAERVHILDDSLSRDRAAGRETAGRIHALADYALSIGADALLFSCSAFGEAISAVRERLQIPVLKPNEAMFAQALNMGTRIGMLATFIPSIASMENEFYAMAPTGATITTIYVDGARQASDHGDQAQHDRLISEAAARLGDIEVLLLAHFSMSTAVDLCAQRCSAPVLAAPDSAVQKLRAFFAG
jgi:Asp/Glu/hydantoin racemase